MKRSLTKKKKRKCKWHNYWMHANYRHNSRNCTRCYARDEMKNVMNEYLSLGHTDALSGALGVWKMEKTQTHVDCSFFCVCAILVYGLNRLNGETPMRRLSAMRIISVLSSSSVSFHFVTPATGMHCHSMWNLFKIWLRCDTIESKSFACSTLVFAILSLGAFFYPIGSCVGRLPNASSPYTFAGMRWEYLFRTLPYLRGIFACAIFCASVRVASCVVRIFQWSCLPNDSKVSFSVFAVFTYFHSVTYRNNTFCRF